MKKILIPIYASFIAGLGAQTTLPTSWDMSNTTTPPVGWSYLNSSGGGLTYTTGNVSPPSLRLDATGEYLQIHFADEPGTITFYARHTGTSGSFNGTLNLEESANGSNWTILKTLKTDLPSTFTKYFMVLATSSRYARIIFNNKQSGYNVAIDDVDITVAPPNNAPKFGASFLGNKLISGKEIFTGNLQQFSINIDNSGLTDTLSIDTVRFSGINATAFSLSTSLPLNIAAGATASLVINVSQAGGEGSRKSLVSIIHNDPKNNPFEIKLNSIVGTKATEPLNKATNLRFTLVKPWRAKVNFDPVSNADNYLVLTKSTSISEKPVDKTGYERGEYIGSARVMWSGPASEVILDKIIANTTYIVTVYSFNGQDGFENYNENQVATVDTITSGLAEAAYYSSISTTDSQMIPKLKSLIRPHFQVFYSNYAPTVVDNFEAYDTSGGRKVLGCYYTGFKHIYTPPLKWDTMSREHSYPYSYMGEASKDSANYSDLHTLLPVEFKRANAIRSNYALGIVKTLTFQFMNGKFGKDSSGISVYEPMDASKGIVARANFYICAAYNSALKPFTIPTSNQLITEKQDQAILKKWNQLYPPDNREIARHEYIASVQNNRNPFIDHPNWACFIDFSNMSFVAGGDCPMLGGNNYISTIKEIEFGVYPNPAATWLSLNLQNFQSADFGFEVFDPTGKMVLSGNLKKDHSTIHIDQLNQGQFLLILYGKNEKGAVAFLKQ